MLQPPSRRQILQAAGFALPLSLCGASALLLGCLSLQGQVLQRRQLLVLQQRRQQQVDQLASAAHLWIADFEAGGSCLRDEPSSHWSELVRERGCAGMLPGSALWERVIDGELVRLEQWQPTPGGGELQLRLPLHEARQRFRWSGAGLEAVGG